MELSLPKKVNVGECITREGCQHEEHFIPTEAKIWLVDQMTKAGFPRIEVTNLMPPKYNPQFRDAEEVLQRIERRKGVEYLAVTMGYSAVKKAVAICQAGYGPTEIYGGVATSEYYSLHNMGRTTEELLQIMPEWVKMAHDMGMKYAASVMTAWGYPVEGLLPIERALDLAEKLVELGVDSLQYGDTTGEATPDRVYDLFSRSKKLLPNITQIAHFHDSRGWGIANCLAALEAGIDHFDSSMGGVGGQVANIIDRVPIPGIGGYTAPSDITGNVSTEDLVVMLDEMGIETGLDIDMILTTGELTEKIFGRRLNSNCVETGRPRKQSQATADS